MTSRVWPALTSKNRIAMLGQYALFFLLIALPIQKKFKIFKSLASLCTSGFAFPEAFQKNIYFYLTDLTLLACLFLLFPLRSLWSKSSRYLTLLFGAAILSLFLSSNASCPLHYIRLAHFFLLLSLFCALEKGAIFQQIKEALPKICMIVLLVSLFECAVGILQYFLRGDLGLGFFGEARGNCWVQSKSGYLFLFDLLFTGTKESLIRRASGTFPHPNVFGGFMVFAIACSYYLIAQRKAFSRAALLALLTVQIFTLCLTFSRAALIAWGTLTLLFFFFCFRLRIHWRASFLTASLSMVLSLAFLLPAVRDRGGIVNYNTIAKESDQERVHFQTIALEMVKKNPFFGVGFNQYVARMQEFSSVKLKGDQFFPVHNMYMLIAAETGLVGLGLFLTFIGSILISVFRSPLTLAKGMLLSLFIGYLFIGFCDFYLLGSQHGKLLFFLVAGLLSLTRLEAKDVG